MIICPWFWKIFQNLWGEIMGRFSVLGLVGLFILSFTGCNKSNHGNITKAPTSNEEVGFIAKLTDTQLESLKAVNSEIGVRVISESNKIYEITKVDEKEISRVSPEFLEKNLYSDNVVSFGKKRNYINNKKAKKIKKPKLTKEESSIETPFNIPNTTPFSECVDNPELAPTIFVEAVSNFSESEIPTINLGEEVKISASKSTPNTKNSKSVLRYIWRAELDESTGLISFPELSNLKPFVNEGSGLIFKPDMVGTYTIFLLVQDDQNVCAFTPVSFVVTDNPRFNELLLKQPTKTVDLKFFPHLKKIEAQTAWDAGFKGQKQVIAVLDTGVNYNHPGIIKNIYINQTEQTSDDLDSDGNNLVDDFMGWDFVNGDKFPHDDQGHGSHVAGLAASTAMGVAPEAKILPVKVLNGFGGGDIASIAAGIFYATDRGSNIINLSLGSDFEEKQIIQKAIDYAESKNVLVIIAAGNGDEEGNGYDIDDPKTENIYPAEFTNKNILTVAATDLKGELTEYSNFGKLSVDIAAPGGDFEAPLFSLSTENPKKLPFVPSQGTSMATPVTSGAAAVIWSSNPKLSAFDVKKLMLKSTQKNYSISSKILSEGNLSLSLFKTNFSTELASH